MREGLTPRDEWVSQFPLATGDEFIKLKFRMSVPYFENGRWYHGDSRGIDTYMFPCDEVS